MIWERYISIQEAGIQDLNGPQQKWLLVMRHILDIKMEKGHAIGEVGFNDRRQRLNLELPRRTV